MRYHRLPCARALQTLAHSLSWTPTGKPQQTLASEIVRSGIGLHSGVPVTARLFPAMAGEGRYFLVGGRNGRWRIPATIDRAVESALCTTLSMEGKRVRTVEHLLSALEGCGVDNCGIEIHGGEEVPALDGSAKGWVEAIEHVGLCDAKDSLGCNKEKMAPILHHPKYVCRNDSFIIALPSSKTHITCGINFPQAPAIGRQWFSCFMDDTIYSKEIASSRTFCIYEEVEKMRNSGLIKGGSAENAIVCSATAGWLNPPLRFDNEPCRHKVLDLVGDFSLFARNGNQGIPLSHVIAYKDCVGAIDGTHIETRLPVGWEGSAHNATILCDVKEMLNGLRVPQSTYLVRNKLVILCMLNFFAAFQIRLALALNMHIHICRTREKESSREEGKKTEAVCTI